MVSSQETSKVYGISVGQMANDLIVSVKWPKFLIVFKNILRGGTVKRDDQFNEIHVYLGSFTEYYLLVDIVFVSTIYCGDYPRLSV